MSLDEGLLVESGGGGAGLLRGGERRGIPGVCGRLYARREPRRLWLPLRDADGQDARAGPGSRGFEPVVSARASGPPLSVRGERRRRRHGERLPRRSEERETVAGESGVVEGRWAVPSGAGSR